MIVGSIAEASGLIRSGALSPVALTAAMLERIERLDPVLNSFNLVCAERALESAREAEAEIAAGRYRGPLHGIPIGIKDLLDVAGLPTTCAMTILADNIGRQNATVVANLIGAGAIILGKLNMTEGALSGYHPALKIPRNPWNPGHWAGVSSSGSGVALAARLCLGAVGSDTGGSIRYPSAANGVVGIKPTYGRVSRHGAFPLAWSLDHIGPMANSVEDAALLLNAMAGYDALDPTSLDAPVPDYASAIGQSLAGLRIGVDANYNSRIDPELARALAEACRLYERRGARIVPVDVTGITAGCDRWFDLTAIEALRAHRAWYPARAGEYGPVFRALLDHGASLSGETVSQAYTAMHDVRRVMHEALKLADVLLCPAMAGPAPSLEAFPPQLVVPPAAVASILTYQAPFNFSGNPTITLPCGFSASDLPLGLQLVGRHLEEATIIRAAHAYERDTAWHTRIPPGAKLDKQEVK